MFSFAYSYNTNLRKRRRVEEKSADEYAASEAAIYAAGSKTSTEDFLFLRGLGEKEGQFDALDATIKTMKENMEDMGEFMENMKKLMEAASGDKLAMQLLEAMVESLEETDSVGNNIDIKA